MKISLRENEQYTHLKIEVHYNKGGYSDIAGRVNARGVYVHVTPVKEEVGENGIVWTSMDLMDKGSFKVLLIEMKRLSRKKLEQAEAAIESLPMLLMARLWTEERYDEMVQAFRYAIANYDKSKVASPA